MIGNNSTKRPSRSTMAGLVYDANKSLNWIMRDPHMTEVFRNSSVIGASLVHGASSRTLPKGSSRKSVDQSNSTNATETKKTTSIPNGKHGNNSSSQGSLASLFADDEEKDLLGIAFLTIWEAGVVLSGYGGTGIVMSRNIVTGEWSGPVAVGCTGFGAGILLGVSVKTMVYLIYDYFTLQSITEPDGAMIFGVGAGATVGSWTKESRRGTNYITSPKTISSAGMGDNVVICKGLAGLYASMSFEAGVCKCRERINAKFYDNREINGADILLSGKTFEIPNSSADDGDASVSNYQAKRMLERVHDKLKRLCCRDGSYALEKSSPELVRASLEELYARDEHSYHDEGESSSGNNSSSDDDPDAEKENAPKSSAKAAKSPLASIKKKIVPTELPPEAEPTEETKQPKSARVLD